MESLRVRGLCGVGMVALLFMSVIAWCLSLVEPWWLWLRATADCFDPSLEARHYYIIPDWLLTWFGLAATDGWVMSWWGDPVAWSMGLVCHGWYALAFVGGTLCRHRNFRLSRLELYGTCGTLIIWCTVNFLVLRFRYRSFLVVRPWVGFVCYIVACLALLACHELSAARRTRSTATPSARNGREYHG